MSEDLRRGFNIAAPTENVGNFNAAPTLDEADLLKKAWQSAESIHQAPENVRPKAVGAVALEYGAAVVKQPEVNGDERHLQLVQSISKNLITLRSRTYKKKAV